MRNLKRFHDTCPRYERYMRSIYDQAPKPTLGFHLRNGRFESYWKSDHRKPWAIKLRRIWRIQKIGMRLSRHL